MSGATAAYGMAWDPTGPWLWIYDQTGTPQTTIFQYNPVTHAMTGVSYVVPLIGGSSAQLAGGLAFTDEHTAGFDVMVGMTQGTPSDMVYVLEMYTSGVPGDLEGEVSELSSGDPIQDAMVVLGSDTTYTNALGEYEFLGVLEGTYDVTASAFGYNPLTESVDIIGGQTTTQDFALPQPIISLDVGHIDVELYPGEMHDETFNIANVGDGELDFDIDVDQPWLECNPATGTVQPSESQLITVSFDIPDTATVGDTWNAEIIVHNNTLSGDQTIPVTVDIVSYVRDIGTGLPLDYALHQNYPNPFNPSTEIRFDLRESAHVTLAVYNILGQNVMTLVDEPLDAGSHLVSFNGYSLTSGVYFYTINAGSFTDMKKMVMMNPTACTKKCCWSPKSITLLSTKNPGRSQEKPMARHL